MELKDFALQILTASTLDRKLSPAPPGLSDKDPGPPLRIDRPARPANLAILPVSEAKVPPREGMVDPGQRARILHALANHELQAVELFSWGILAFPNTPQDFRWELFRLIEDEQRHCRMYMARLKAWKAALGDYAVSGYFWSKVKDFTTPLRFVCGMALTFENANLDHAEDYAEAARNAGDRETAVLLEKVHEDEVEHVRFGWRWLKEWKAPGQSMSEAYSANVTWPLRPALARGKVFHRQGREAAGLDPEFIRLLAEAERDVLPPKTRRS